MIQLALYIYKHINEYAHKTEVPMWKMKRYQNQRIRSTDLEEVGKDGTSKYK